MLEVKDLTFEYQEKPTITKVSFTLHPGDFTCLLGNNGSGKTTILKSLNRLLKPKSGEILFQNQNLHHLGPKEIARLLAFVPQEHIPTFSFLVQDVILMGVTPYLSFGVMPGEKEYQRSEKIMEMLGIYHLCKRKYNQISGGERQLVLLGRALMQETQYLLLDEPTSHLDFKNQHLLMQGIKELSHQGKGILVTLHDPNLALKYCDRAILIKEGRVVAQGKTWEVITASNLKKTYDLDVEMKQITEDFMVALPK